VTSLRGWDTDRYVRRDNRKQIRPPAGTAIPNEGLTDQEVNPFPMADPQSNARLRAGAGAPTTGVIHVRTRLTADFTVISNALAQRRGSAVTIGVAAYIASLPDGSPVTITALCEHFSEGEILISRALRDLEAAGYLERRRERTPTGQVRTRTYFYDVPGGAGPKDPPEPPKPRRARTADQTAPCRDTVPDPGPEEPESPAPVLAHAAPEAVDVLTSLRRVDPRLVLSAQEAARLAPAVTEWLAAGVGPREITELLTVRLPDRFRARPASVLAFRLRETPLPVPPPAPLPPDAGRPLVLPFQTCDGCERAFRAPGPGYCRSCRDRLGEEQLRAVG
jgi:DNA-binding transcriptional ArsR family regulator